MSWRIWRQVALFFVAPIVAFGLLLSSAHYAVFGYFGLSHFRGHATLGVVLMLLEDDTKTDYPEITRRLRGPAKKFQDTYAQLDGREAQDWFLHNTYNDRLRAGFNIVNEYMQQNPEKMSRSDTSRHESFYAFFGGLSELNERLNRYPVHKDPYYLAKEDLYANINTQIYLSNLEQLAKLTWVKLRSSWEDLILVTRVPHEIQGMTLRPEIEGFGFGKQDPDVRFTENFFFNRLPFDAVAGMQYFINQMIFGEALILVVGLLAVVWVFVQVVRGREISPALAMGAYGFVALFAYMFLLSFAHVPLGRYIMPALPLSVALMFSPIYFCSEFCRSRPWRLVLEKLYREGAQLASPSSEKT